MFARHSLFLGFHPLHQSRTYTNLTAAALHRSAVELGVRVFSSIYYAATFRLPVYTQRSRTVPISPLLASYTPSFLSLYLHHSRFTSPRAATNLFSMDNDLQWLDREQVFDEANIDPRLLDNARLTEHVGSWSTSEDSNISNSVPLLEQAEPDVEMVCLPSKQGLTHRLMIILRHTPRRLLLKRNLPPQRRRLGTKGYGNRLQHDNTKTSHADHNTFRCRSTRLRHPIRLPSRTKADSKQVRTRILDLPGNSAIPMVYWATTLLEHLKDKTLGQEILTTTMKRLHQPRRNTRHRSSATIT